MKIIDEESIDEINPKISKSTKNVSLKHELHAKSQNSVMLASPT